MQSDQEEQARSLQSFSNQNSNQSASANEDPGAFGELLSGAAKAVLAAPLDRYHRARRRILLACPEFGDSWACEYVAWLVGEGQVPERSLEKVLERFRRQLSRDDALELAGRERRIVSPVRYFARCLWNLVVKEFGLPWENRGRDVG